MDARIKIHTPKTAQAGFSLIELLIVITVVAILTISAGLSLSLGQTGARAQDDAQQFQSTFNGLRENAIHGRRMRAMMVSGTGWQVAQFDLDKNRWTTTNSQRHTWAGAALLRHTGPRIGATGAPDIVLLPDGRATPFELRLTLGASSAFCVSDGWTGLTCSSE